VWNHNGAAKIQIDGIDKNELPASNDM